MRKLTLSILFTFIFLAAAGASAQTNPVQITGGRFFISDGTQNSTNARIETENFTATSSFRWFETPWWNICVDPVCRPGRTFTVTSVSTIYVGGCVGSCYNFVAGTFTIGGVTYQNVYFRGNFNFEQVNFQVPKTARRKGSIALRKPFTMDGRLQACEVSDVNQSCPANKVLFVGDIKGEGILTVTGEIRTYNNYTYLYRKSFDYQFEP